MEKHYFGTNQDIFILEGASLTIIIKAVIALIFSFFMPLTAISFFQFRLKKRKQELHRVVTSLMRGQKSGIKAPSFDEVHDPISYILPVSFAFWVTLFGNIYLLFTDEIFANTIPGSESLLLSGMFIGDPLNNHQFQMQSCAVIAFAMTGGFMWSSKNIIKRLMAADLTPGLYYSTGMRMTLAALTALMIFFASKLSPTTSNAFTSNLMPGIAFLVGMFPDRGITYLRDKVKIFSKTKDEEFNNLTLQTVEGMNSFLIDRLEEVGIDNVQNLAEAKFTDLLMRTPFQARVILDWIAQAKLIQYYKEDIDILRKASVRTVFDFKTAGEKEGQLERLAEQTGIPLLTLQITYQNICGNLEIEILQDFHAKLIELEEEKFVEQEC